jgi:hypothetical protein
VADRAKDGGMTIDEMIAVLQAYKEGKPIEYRSVIGYPQAWIDLKISPMLETRWDFYVFEYRVKREPRRLYVLFNEYGPTDYATTPSYYGSTPVIEFIEVMK